MRRVLFRLGIGIVAVLVVGWFPRATAQIPDSCFGDPVTDPRATEVADFLSGTDEVDVIALADGDDQYFAALGGDQLCGGNGNDVLVGEGGPDRIDGGQGDDLIAGFGGADDLRANLGADELRGNGGADTLRAAQIDDERDDIYDGPGPDTIIGNDEDFWHKCSDGATDDHSEFTGNIVPDPDCDVT